MLLAYNYMHMITNRPFLQELLLFYHYIFYFANYERIRVRKRLNFIKHSGVIQKGLTKLQIDFNNIHAEFITGAAFNNGNVSTHRLISAIMLTRFYHERKFVRLVIKHNEKTFKFDKRDVYSFLRLPGRCYPL